ncbi:MAG: hypothetical protein ABI627_16870 [Polyangiaceae bacterium]
MREIEARLDDIAHIDAQIAAAGIQLDIAPPEPKMIRTTFSIPTMNPQQARARLAVLQGARR